VGSNPEQARRARRAGWTGEIVRVGGTPKGGLYRDLPLSERLAAYATLNERAWLASGRRMPEAVSRREWPGEAYRLEAHA
jgi:hypothetical protein